MCGIAGIWYKSRDHVLEPVIKKMTDSIKHRGPDGEGMWVDKEMNLALGHRRLSIIDLSDNAAQPMRYLDRYVITFNGEIYNYVELQSTLSGLGYKFNSSSDTEVILAAFDKWGKDCLNHFDGMFAFCIYDRSSKELFCARDRFGEKPFFYSDNSETFAFASEMKALFAAGISKEVSDEMMYYYLMYDVVENPDRKEQTFYKGIKQLPASHYMIINSQGNIKVHRYWDIDPNKQIDISMEEATERFRELFDRSIQRRMRSDVRVGSSLSGGLDSSSVLCSILELYPDTSFHTFTARFEDSRFDEGHFVDLLLDHNKFQSFNCFPSADQVINELDKIFFHQEEPFGSTSIIAQWEVMKLAKEHDTIVLLDGQGADETLSGYFKYFLPYLHTIRSRSKKEYTSELNLIQSNLGLSPISGAEKYRMVMPGMFDAFSDMTRKYRSKNIASHLSSDFRDQHGKLKSPFHRDTDLNHFLYNDVFQYGLGKLLRFSDRNAMAHSIEVRLPYLDHELVEFAFSLSPEKKMGEGWNKLILRKAMEGRVPKEICYRKDKKGFAPPTDWMEQKNIKELINSSRKQLKERGYLGNEDLLDPWRSIMAAKVIG